MVCNRLAVIHLLIALILAILSPRIFAREDSRDEVFSAADLDQILAPVALYPDALLSQILMAATYPLDVVEASRWSAAQPRLDGAAAVEAVEGRNWDPSVKALVAFPELLARMDDNLQWTHRLGDAYLTQEEDVIDSIQRLREEAYAAGYLNNLEYARAYREREVIIIEPASPVVVYVPYYQPAMVYHRWWSPIYPSFYWGPPPGYHSNLVFYWGRGVRVAPVFFYSTFHWQQRHIVIVDRSHYRPHFTVGVQHSRFNNAYRWNHDPTHRRGASYSHQMTRQKFPSYHGSREAFGQQRQAPQLRRESFSRDGGYSREGNLGNKRQSDFTGQPGRRAANNVETSRRETGRPGTDGQHSVTAPESQARARSVQRSGFSARTNIDKSQRTTKSQRTIPPGISNPREPSSHSFIPGNSTHSGVVSGRGGRTETIGNTSGSRNDSHAKPAAAERTVKLQRPQPVAPQPQARQPTSDRQQVARQSERRAETSFGRVGNRDSSRSLSAASGLSGGNNAAPRQSQASHVIEPGVGRESRAASDRRGKSFDNTWQGQR